MKSFDEWKEANLDEDIAVTRPGQSKADWMAANRSGSGPAEAPAEAPAEEPAETDPHAALEKGDVAVYLKLVQRAAGVKGVYNPQTVAALKKALQADPTFGNFLKVLGNMKVGQQARLAKGVTKI